MMNEIIKNQMPIGVFDSGIGGLSVVKQMFESLGNEDIVYFGDTARVPYGSKSNKTVIEYSVQNSNFLMTKNVKAIVVACNTASSVALPTLREKFNVPVLGVIEPGAEMAVKNTTNKKIGVIGTRATIMNRAYSKAINSIDPTITVYEEACPLFVPLVEEGWINHSVTRDVAKEYLSEFRDLEIDTLILGCTHYPLIAKVIQDVVGKDVTLIDSGIATAQKLNGVLLNEGLKGNKENADSHEFFVSDLPTRFKNVAEMFLGMPINQLSRVDLDYLVAL